VLLLLKSNHITSTQIIAIHLIDEFSYTNGKKVTVQPSAKAIYGKSRGFDTYDSPTS
jgi:hypothetical protein